MNQLFSSVFYHSFNPHQPINEAQIYFVFLSVGQKALWANWGGNSHTL